MGALLPLVAVERRPTGLGSGFYKDNVDYGIYCGEGCIGRIYETRPGPESLRWFYRALYDDRPTQEIFLNGMTAGSLLTAQARAKEFPWRDYRTIIDIGTAQGCLPVEIVYVHPHLSGGGFDLPAIGPTSMSYIRKHGLSDRMRHVGFRDIRTQPLDDVQTAVIGIKAAREWAARSTPAHRDNRASPGPARMRVGSRREPGIGANCVALRPLPLGTGRLFADAANRTPVREPARLHWVVW